MSDIPNGPITSDESRAVSLLSRVILPRPGEPLDVRKLYIVESDTNARRAHAPTRTSLEIGAESEVSFATYFNAFPARYWRRWSDPRLVVMALNNRELAFVTWEERVQIGDPKWPASQHLPDIPYAEVARLMGLGGRRVERPEEIGPAWDEALAADRPFVLDILADPDVPPLPPHLTLGQVRAFSQALWRGEPDPGGAIAGAAKQILGRLLPEG